MKGLATICVLILSVGFSLQALAGDSHSCAPESKDCAPVAADGQHAKAGGHHDLDAKMNSLFPGKPKNVALATTPMAANTVEPKFLAVVPAGKVKLQWSDSKAPEYHLQVATDPNFKWLVVNEKFLKTTSYEVTAETGKKYFWRVAAYNQANDSYFTKSSFTSSVFSTK